MSTPDGQVHLTFNGEILNYRELRSQVDFPFRTAGDTETLLAVYMAYGLAGVERLRGQFAFAIYDQRTDQLHLARDRLGILPLHYFSCDRFFSFASEIKALFPVMDQLNVDRDSLHEYLAQRSVPAPRTLIQGVRKLEPGNVMTVYPDGRRDVRSYWQLPNLRPPRVTPNVATEMVAEALNDSIAEALVADVPVGTYLSGGLDSSLITALVAEARGGEGLHTFSAGFGDERVDEVAWARRVAAVVGSEHHEVTVTADDFRENWARLSWHRDAPLSEPADVAVFKLAELARRNVKVVLSGEGADELFGGYPKYRFARMTRWAGVVPNNVRGTVLRRLDRNLPASMSRLGVAVRALGEPTADERVRGWFAPFTSVERQMLVGTTTSRSAPQTDALNRHDALGRMLYSDSRSWLADNLLERGDRMSMAASLELRPPFLDHRLVELAFSLPSSVKVRGRVTKWVVKEVARRLLPNEVVDRPKAGFKVPLDAWFRGGLKEMAMDLLVGPSSFVSEVLDEGVVRQLLKDHTSGARDEQIRLWTLLSLEVWHRQLVEQTKNKKWPVTRTNGSGFGR